jgi:hypothetical protein
VKNLLLQGLVWRAGMFDESEHGYFLEKTKRKVDVFKKIREKKGERGRVAFLTTRLGKARKLVLSERLSTFAQRN